MCPWAVRAGRGSDRLLIRVWNSSLGKTSVARFSAGIAQARL